MLLLLVGTLLFIGLIELSFNWAYITAPSDYLACPISSSDLSKMNYQEAEHSFEDAGFTNVEVVDLNDLTFFSSITTKDGSVDSITVNGEKSFSTIDKYAPDSPVKIYYHSFPD